MATNNSAPPRVWGKWFIFAVTIFLSGVAGLFLAAVAAQRLGYKERAERYLLWGTLGMMAVHVAAYPLPSGGEWRYVNNGINAGFAALWMTLAERDLARFGSAGGETEDASRLQGIAIGVLGFVMAVVLFGGIGLILSAVGFPTLEG